MFVPDDAIIPIEKLTKYLLVPRPWDDKSAFLARAGFTAENTEDLIAFIRDIARHNDAIKDGANDYGVFWCNHESVTLANGRSIAVTLVWLQWHSDGSFHFVTLKPWKERI